MVRVHDGEQLQPDAGLRFRHHRCMSIRAVSTRQLAMFMTPQEVSHLRAGDFGDVSVKDGNNLRQQMSERYEVQEGSRGEPYRGETRSPNDYISKLKNSIDKSQGIQEPAHIWHSNGDAHLMDGHHRAAVAMETNRLLPVVHHDQPDRGDAATSAFMGPTAEKGLWSGDR